MATTDITTGRFTSPRGAAESATITRSAAARRPGTGRMGTPRLSGVSGKAFLVGSAPKWPDLGGGSVERVERAAYLCGPNEP
jgi:hypothetical protein